ncbi:hypothetical protein ACFV1L_18305 [Kitasatospora sp. NPDC059646]|uniref:hypothetical protein n=1 Tax=Kitasatospora sp. NPDC059646 TaxID=3346893 RepID=UPI0036A09723
MTTPPRPGHSLDVPFDLESAAADLLAVNRLISELAQNDDGSASNAAAINAARRLAGRISDRISEHTR